MKITICSNDECITSNPMFCRACADVEDCFRREVGDAWFYAVKDAAMNRLGKPDSLDISTDFRDWHGGRFYSHSMGGVVVDDAVDCDAVSAEILAAGEAAAREAVEAIKASLAETE